MEDGIFYVEGEDLDGEYIEFDFNGDIDSCVLECEKTLALAGGGHLDIFIVEDEHEVFVRDVEL